MTLKNSLSEQDRRALKAEVRAALYPRASPRRDVHGRAIWPRMPPKPKAAPRRTMPTARVANKGEGRSDLEILSRMGGGTTYRTPEAGRSTRRGGGTDDLAHALGFVEDPLEQRLALALAVSTTAEWVDIEKLAAAPLLRQLLGSHGTRSLVQGKARHRVRLILREVFFDLVMPRIPMATFEASKALKINRADYCDLYEATAGFLETLAHSGAHTAVQALRNEE